MDTSLLLQTLASRSGLGDNPNVAALLGNAGGDNTSALLANLLAQRQNENQKSDDTDDALVESEKEKAQLLRQLQRAERRLIRSQERYSELAATVQELRTQFEDTYVELEELRRRNNLMSAALGACYLCWGSNPQCEVCNGKGRPGFFRLNRRLLIELVAPALRQLQRLKSRKNNLNTLNHQTSSQLFNQPVNNPLKGDSHE